MAQEPGWIGRSETCAPCCTGLQGDGRDDLGTRSAASQRCQASATAANIGPSAVLPPASVINTIATTTVVDGALQVEWWDQQAGTTAFRFSQAVRQGMTEGRTNQRSSPRCADLSA